MQEFINEFLRPSSIILSAVIGLLTFLFFEVTKKTFTSSSNLVARECNEPNCVRCNKQTQTLRRAQDNFEKLVPEGQYISLEEALIDPTPGYLLFLPELRREALWSSDGIPCSLLEDLNLLKSNFGIVLNEFRELSAESSDQDWSKLYFLNQGVWGQEICNKCPRTFDLISSLKNLMKDCAFGYAFFSIIGPGTEIAEHTGPTNVRLRCHLSVQIPPLSDGVKLELKVGSRTVAWKQRDWLLFDDSFPHSVSYSKTEAGARVVLLLDFWHPDLTHSQRNYIAKVFPTDMIS